MGQAPGVSDSLFLFALAGGLLLAGAVALARGRRFSFRDLAENGGAATACVLLAVVSLIVLAGAARLPDAMAAAKSLANGAAGLFAALALFIAFLLLAAPRRQADEAIADINPLTDKLPAPECRSASVFIKVERLSKNRKHVRLDIRRRITVENTSAAGGAVYDWSFHADAGRFPKKRRKDETACPVRPARMTIEPLRPDGGDAIEDDAVTPHAALTRKNRRACFPAMALTIPPASRLSLKTRAARWLKLRAEPRGDGLLEIMSDPWAALEIVLRNDLRKTLRYRASLDGRIEDGALAPGEKKSLFTDAGAVKRGAAFELDLSLA
ncbi:MAG: hypothetical protein R3C58_09060 [Parvularculaceae bacterium]